MTQKEKNILFFLTVYFYELEQKFNLQEKALSDTIFQSEEANTDEFYKKFMKSFMLKYNDIKETTVSAVSIQTSENVLIGNTEDFKEFKIISIQLPKELTKTQKENISKKKTSVYTSPDLYVQISGYNITHYLSVELKSTKRNTIPGSSVKQVDPNEWMIFFNRKANRISTGKYINSITEKLPFPDRAPRPSVAFKTLNNWNKENRKIVNNDLIVQRNEESTNRKIKLLNDWQDYLTDEWIQIIKSSNRKKTEKWFNYAIRKFALKLLQHSKELNEGELENLIRQLKKMIK